MKNTEQIIYLTLREVRDQGWDLIDEFTSGDEQKAIKMVYDAIEDEIW